MRSYSVTPGTVWLESDATERDRYDRRPACVWWRIDGLLSILDEAIEELTEGARLMPENSHIQAQLAIALYGSFRSGNAAAEDQMNSRIQRALLLDPDHLETLILKTEILVERSRYSTAIRELSDLTPDAQDRVRAKTVKSLETTFERRLSDRKWDGAQWCWVTLQPIDSEVAKKLAIQFLQLHHYLLPEKIMITPKPDARSTGLMGWRSKTT